MNILVIDNGLGPFVDEQIKSISSIDRSIKITRYSFSGINNKLNYIRAIFEINKLIRKNSIDIVHAHYGLTGFISLFQNKCPVICTFHGSDVLYVKWQSILSRFVSKHCDISIAVSSKIANKLNSNNVFVIPCGVNIEFFHPEDKNNIREKLGLKRDLKYILFPSDPNRKVKNYSLFLKVLNKLKNTYDIEQLILEGLTREQVRDYLNAADVTLITSFSEGSNTVLKESLACNTPVVSTNTGDAFDILDNDYITSYEVNEISDVIRNILSSRFKIYYRNIISPFNLCNISNRIIKLYHLLRKYDE